MKRTSNYMDWQEYNEYKKELRNKEEPKRFQYFKNKIEEYVAKGEINIVEEDSSMIIFVYKDYKIRFFPFTGWWQGNKDFGNGRGVKSLFSRLEKK